MINPISSFNVKVLGWFWLTLLMCLLAIVLPALFISRLDDDTRLTDAQLSLLNNTAQRIDRFILRGGDFKRFPMRNAMMINRRIPYHIMLFDDELQMVMSTAPIRKALQAHFDGKRFWHFIHREQPGQINIEWSQMVGPVSLTSKPGWKLVLWRPERPKLFDVFQRFPLWVIIPLFLLVTSVMSWLLVRSIARPLNRLGEAFNAVGEGQLTHTIDLRKPTGRDRHLASSSQFSRLFLQFNEMTAKIAALIQNQKRQSADISHELRTPLTRLQMTLALLKKKNHDSDLISLLARAERECELLNQHIERLSALTTMEALAIQKGRKCVSVQNLLAGLCDDAAFEAKERRIDWHHSLIDTQIVVFTEPLITAIENVVRNAFKYANTAVSLECITTDSAVCIVVSDDGPGVAVNELDNLIRAFYRTDSARHGETGGLGLGLAIAAEAVRLNNGRIEFALNKPTGLQVTFVLPIPSSSDHLPSI